MKNLIKNNLIVLFIFVLMPRLIIPFFHDSAFFSRHNTAIANTITILIVLSGIYLFSSGVYNFNRHVKYIKFVAILFMLLGLGLVGYVLYSLLIFSLWSNYTGL